MNVEVVLLPRDLKPPQVHGRTVVVFDVLRATTTITAALAAGVREIRAFDSLEAARVAASKSDPAPILCGELSCLPPAGFDLGNSPRQWNRADHANRTVYLATTNGTRAIAAVVALNPHQLLVGAMVNAHAAAAAAESAGRDITLLCSGTNDDVSLEDTLGAAAVLAELRDVEVCGDAARIATRLFATACDDLPRVMRQGAGGRNLARAGLEADIDLCALLNSLPIVGIVRGGNPASGIIIQPM